MVDTLFPTHPLVLSTFELISHTSFPLLSHETLLGTYFLLKVENISDLAKVRRVGLVSYVQSLLFRAHEPLESGIVQHHIL